MSDPPSSKKTPDKNNTPFQFLEKVLEYIKWVAVEPIWQAYRDFGSRIAIIAGIFIFGIFYLAITIPLSIFASFLSLVGVMETGPIVTGRYTPAMFLALTITVYGGYQTYQRSGDRRTVYQYCQNPTIENAVKAFEYTDNKDPVVRANAARAIVDGTGENPGKFFKSLEVDEEEAVSRLVNLLNDDDEDAQIASADALAMLSRDFPRALIPYREKVYDILPNQNSAIQISVSAIIGNMTASEPSLSDEALENLEPLSEDPDSTVRKGVALALFNIRTERATKLLDTLTRDSHPNVRETAIEIIEAQQEGQNLDLDQEMFDF